MSHRPPPTPHPVHPAGPALHVAVTRLAAVAATVNLATGLTIALAPSGASASLAVLAALAPLPLWGTVFAVAGLVQLARRFVVAHIVALTAWQVLAIGAVIGLVSRATPSPAGSILLTVLSLGMVAQHAIGLLYRRRVRRDPSGAT